MHISRGAVYAVYGLRYLAEQNQGRVTPLPEIARSLGIPERYLAKVFQRLAKTRLVRSERGQRGGFILAIPAPRLAVLDVVEAVDGRRGNGACALEVGACTGHTGCRAADAFSKADAATRDALRDITLSDLVSCPRRDVLAAVR